MGQNAISLLWPAITLLSAAAADDFTGLLPVDLFYRPFCIPIRCPDSVRRPGPFARSVCRTGSFTVPSTALLPPHFQAFHLDSSLGSFAGIFAVLYRHFASPVAGRRTLPPRTQKIYIFLL